MRDKMRAMDRIPSPFQSKELTGMALQMKIMADLTRLHKQFNAGIEKLAEIARETHAHAAETKEHIARVSSLPPGPPGKPGKPGDNTPIKGVDYFSEADKNELMGTLLKKIPPPQHGDTPQKGIDYFTPEDIQSIAEIVRAGMVIPSEDEIVEKAVKKMPKKKIHVSEIDGYENADSVLRRYIANGSRHGAGDTVAAGTNVTITTDANGKKVINTTGAGTFYSEVLTDSGDHRNFTAAHTINAVLSLQDGSGHGLPLKDASGNTNYTFAGTTLTLSAPDANLAAIGINMVYA